MRLPLRFSPWSPIISKDSESSTETGGTDRPSRRRQPVRPARSQTRRVLAMKPPIRVGAVSYLNAKPLYYRLCEFAPDVRLSMDVPSRLAEQLAAGELDVALIPSVEYLRGVERGYEIMPGFAIAARGPVRSVKLFSRVPWDRIERLALDAGSRTSQALAQDLARRAAWRPAGGRRGAAAGRLGAGEHGRRRARDRRPGHEGPARAVPRRRRPGRGLGGADRPAVRLRALGRARRRRPG